MREKPCTDEAYKCPIEGENKFDIVICIVFISQPAYTVRNSVDRTKDQKAGCKSEPHCAPKDQSIHTSGR